MAQQDDVIIIRTVENITTSILDYFLNVALVTEISEDDLIAGQSFSASGIEEYASLNAMAEKFKAEAIASTNDKTAEMAMKQSVEMQQFMKEQMQMRRDMALAGMAVKDNSQKALFASKQDEINRFADGVNNAVNSVSSALKNPNTIVQNGINLKESSVSKSAKVCPNCNKKNEDGAMFCESCGTSL